MGTLDGKSRDRHRRGARHRVRDRPALHPGRRAGGDRAISSRAPARPRPRRSGPRAASSRRCRRGRRRRNLVAETCRVVRHARHPGQQCRHHPRGGFSRHRGGRLRPRAARNLKGAFLVGQAAARQMVAQVEGGQAPRRDRQHELGQCPRRHTQPGTVLRVERRRDQLTKVMALSLSPYGIRVNAIGPGSIMTDILKGVATDKAAQQRLLSRTPLGRIADPDEIASVAVVPRRRIRAT